MGYESINKVLSIMRASDEFIGGDDIYDAIGYISVENFSPDEEDEFEEI